jgi:hypothetical protein
MCGFNMQRLPIRDQDIISELIIIIIIIINTIIYIFDTCKKYVWSDRFIDRSFKCVSTYFFSSL